MVTQVIPTVGRSDQGAYYCEADNGLGQAGKAELQVLYPFILYKDTKINR